MVVAYLGGGVDDERIKPIASIIERRLWTLAPSAQDPAPAPVPDQGWASGLGLAVIGRRHFGNPIPREWYAAAKELLEKAAPGCADPMCACRGGPCAECPDGEHEKELDDLRSSLDFYKRRCDALQACQSTMRDPERIMVCDILANGSLLINGKGKLDAERYAVPCAAVTHEPLTPAQRQEMGVAATIELPSPENCYLRGIQDAERAHGIGEAQPPVQPTGAGNV